MTNIKIPLKRSEFNADPFIQFEQWYLERLCTGEKTPNNMSLATSTPDGDVSVRTVLLKEHDSTGFIFYSNYKSRKGKQLSSNPKAALLFYWPELNRQVRTEGVVKKVSAADSDAYFASRPLESQISAWASEQSRVIADREYLEDRFLKYSKKYLNKPVERPEYWGGYRLIPSWFEFWQDGEFRLHDRITYTYSSGKWIVERLAP
jgi:pyridoxamine 5'-phosphate oxidase